MSTGPEHYAEAERLLAWAWGGGDAIHWSAIASAQAHATLALAAATALSGVIGNNVAASHPINKLADDTETITAANDWHEVSARNVHGAQPSDIPAKPSTPNVTPQLAAGSTVRGWTADWEQTADWKLARHITVDDANGSRHILHVTAGEHP